MLHKHATGSVKKFKILLKDHGQDFITFFLKSMRRKESTGTCTFNSKFELQISKNEKTNFLIIDVEMLVRQSY